MGRRTLFDTMSAAPEWSEKKALDELTREYNMMKRVYFDAGIKVSEFKDAKLTDGITTTSYSSHT